MDISKVKQKKDMKNSLLLKAKSIGRSHWKKHKVKTHYGLKKPNTSIEERH